MRTAKPSRRYAFWSVLKAPRCNGRTRRGKPCPNPAKRGMAKCWKHEEAK
jgi:hypothetical protein